MKKVAFLLLNISIAFASIYGQSKVEERDEYTEITEFSQVIKKGKADHSKLLVNVSGGSLHLKKTTNNLAKVDFSYNNYDWDPSVSYTESQEGGKLQIKARTNGDEQRVSDNNSCRIQLNPNHSYSLGIVLGAGLANLDLSNFKIDKALFRLGVGSFNINLSNTSIPLLKIDAGIGEATIDLSGKWDNNLIADINAGIGDLKIIVPKKEGVRLSISGFLGDINTPGYNNENKVYTNSAYDTAENKLEFTIAGAIGSITIIER